jgi:hypothetical protein
MTTATPGSRTARRGVLVLGPLAATLVTSGLLVLVAAVADDGAAAYGAATGAAMVAGFFTVGAVLLAVVGRLVPAASLLVALLTYTLQVVLVAAVSVALSRSGLLDSTLDPRWLGGAVIVCTVAWLAALVVLVVRSRQPLFEVPDQGQEASVR